MKAEVAIVGNGVAGYACAARLARHGLRPLLIGPGLPVDRPPLSKSALAKGEPTLLADAGRLAELGIGLVDGLVTEADLAARRLVVPELEIEADAIVLATGLSYSPPPVTGLERAHVNATPEGMRALAADLSAGPRSVVLVGGGLVGVETALTLNGAGHAVTVLDALARPADRLHEPLPGLLAGYLAEAGVTFVGEAPLERVDEHAGGLRVVHAEGVLDADVIVAATGGRVEPPPGLARTVLEESGEGIAVEADGAVPGLERVYAAGDLVTLPHERFGQVRFPQWDGAVGSGEHVADAIAGVGSPYARLPYWWSDLGEHRVAEVGWAGAVAAWEVEGGLHVGRDAEGAVAAVLVVDQPRRLREARALVGA